mgnify:CR=1 FL=1
MIIANEARSASLAIYHLISNASSWNNVWSRGEQLVLFSRESWCFPRRSRGKHRYSRENEINLFPEGPYFKCLICGIQQILQSDWFRERAESFHPARSRRAESTFIKKCFDFVWKPFKWSLLLRKWKSFGETFFYNLDLDFPSNNHIATTKKPKTAERLYSQSSSLLKE